MHNRKIRWHLSYFLILVTLTLGIDYYPSYLHSHQQKPPTKTTNSAQQRLEQTLRKEGSAALAKAARSKGNAKRGARVFYQHTMACTKCHTTGTGISPLGPDLAKLGKETKLTHIIESILEPSKVIKKEYKTVRVTTVEGRTFVGLLTASPRPGHIVLRDAAQIGKVMLIAKKDIDDIQPSKVSIMPTGLVNQLANREEFLDLVRYLAEIAKHGPALASKLEPDPSELRRLAIEHVDHVKQIRQLGAADVKIGHVLYKRYCMECHGKDGNKTVNPLARRFAKDKLKFGTDPYSMWKTITYGNGLMFPQSGFLKAKQRYQIVHYIREQFVKPNNPSQYFKLTDKYLALVNPRAKIDAQKLAQLPPTIKVGAGMIDGTQGRHMDYGPYLCHSVAFTKPKNRNAPRFENTTERALVVKLPGEHVVCYDTERYSVAGIWRGSLANTAKTHHTSYKGSSCLTPGGEVLYTNTDATGWAINNLKSPATEKHLQFNGYYLHSGQVLLRYKVGDRRVEEMPSSTVGRSPILSRTFRIGSGGRTLYCLVGKYLEEKQR